MLGSDDEVSEIITEDMPDLSNRSNFYRNNILHYISGFVVKKAGSYMKYVECTKLWAYTISQIVNVFNQGYATNWLKAMLDFSSYNPIINWPEISFEASLHIIDYKTTSPLVKLLYVTYVCAVWGSYSASNVKRIQIL